jgi:hypothetical protein
MFDVKITQSMDVKDFCREHWDDIFNDIDRNIRDYLLANFGSKDSPIFSVFVSTANYEYMPEILKELITIAEEQKEMDAAGIV